MKNRRVAVPEDIELQVLRRLQDAPDLSQRALAKELGISLGSVNFCFQGLMQKGWVKIQNFSHSKHKMGYVYLLTPSGIAQKSRLTARFLKRKMEEYEALRQVIEELRDETASERNEK